MGYPEKASFKSGWDSTLICEYVSGISATSCRSQDKSCFDFMGRGFVFVLNTIFVEVFDTIGQWTLLETSLGLVGVLCWELLGYSFFLRSLDYYDSRYGLMIANGYSAL